MRIGIYGGTFDPPHLGHLRAAELARESLCLDRVWFMVSPDPPHKRDREKTPFPLRFAMTEIAVRENPYFEVSDFEARHGLSYTVDTMRALKREFPHDFFLIVGEDSFLEFPTWKDYQHLVRENNIIVIKRKWTPFSPPSWSHALSLKIKHLREGERDCGKGLFFLSCATLPISSSMIREKIREGLSVRYLVPEGVREYIIKEVLYR